jgi:hypothetical protein
VAKLSDDFKTGQSALLYKADIDANNDDNTIPDEINIRAIKPKPRIIERH